MNTPFNVLFVASIITFLYYLTCLLSYSKFVPIHEKMTLSLIQGKRTIVEKGATMHADYNVKYKNVTRYDIGDGGDSENLCEKSIETFKRD